MSDHPLAPQAEQAQSVDDRASSMSVPRLEAGAAEDVQRYGDHSHFCPACFVQVTQAEADAQTLDARRYRWLRDKANFGRKSDPMVCLYPLGDQQLIDGAELDAAMDAAMKVGVAA